MSQDNLRAALIAAASMYPEGYGMFRDLKAITSTQTTQLIFDRAEEIAAWLDAKEEGRTMSAHEALVTVQNSRTPDPTTWSDELRRDYARWLDEMAFRDSATNRQAFVDGQR